MHTIQLSRREAALYLTYYHGLHPKRQTTGKEGILSVFRKLQSIQFDPINVTGTNPDLVLQSRVTDYNPAMLQELLYRDRLLVDGWDKMMCIYPIEDWALFAPIREAVLDENRISDRARRLKPVMDAVLRQMRDNGPLSSLDTGDFGSIDWFWAPAKQSRAALETLFSAGVIGIHHRIGTRKYYDLNHRLFPEKVLHRNPSQAFNSEDAYLALRLERRVRSYGLLWDKAGDGWLGLPKIRIQHRRELLGSLAERGILQPIMIEGSDSVFYTPSDNSCLIREACETRPNRDLVSFIAPLDNMIWDRKLIEFLFGFQYRWEIYKPAEQRDYGYYVLPVLFNSMFPARFEPVRTKKSDCISLIIKNWWWEEETKTEGDGKSTSGKKQALLQALPKALYRFSRMLGAADISCAATVPREIQKCADKAVTIIHSRHGDYDL